VITDQFWDYVNQKPITIPDDFRTSYRNTAIWLLANNYEVPDELMKRASK